MRHLLIISLLLLSQISQAQKLGNRPIATQTAPVFTGGNAALYAFVSQHIIYSEQAQKANVIGKLYTKFRVTEQGKVDSIQVIKHFGFGIDKELIRVLKLTAGRWQPGRVNGKRTAMFVDFPLTICPD